MNKRDKLMNVLNMKFPKGWFKPSEDFDGVSGGIWTGEGAYDNDDMCLFDYYDNTGYYVNGLHPALQNILDQHGFFAEPYDSGTWLIWE